MVSCHLLVGLWQLGLGISNITLLMIVWRHLFYHLGHSLLLGNGATAVSVGLDIINLG